jgi:hypothetical protein
MNRRGTKQQIDASVLGTPDYFLTTGEKWSQCMKNGRLLVKLLNIVPF